MENLTKYNFANHQTSDIYLIISVEMQMCHLVQFKINKTLQSEVIKKVGKNVQKKKKRKKSDWATYLTRLAFHFHRVIGSMLISFWARLIGSQFSSITRLSTTDLHYETVRFQHLLQNITNFVILYNICKFWLWRKRGCFRSK